MNDDDEDFRSLWERFTDGRWFDFACLLIGLFLSLMCVGGVVWAVQSGNDPAYEPPRVEKGTPAVSELYPTPTRIQLLRDIANGQVATDITSDEGRIVLFPYAPTEWQTKRTVTKRVLELRSAGWISEDFADWHLTDKGREILRGAS